MKTKLKTHRGAAKRFKRTANGVKRKPAGLRHILTKKSSKRKRKLRKLVQVTKRDVPAVEQMLADGTGE